MINEKNIDEDIEFVFNGLKDVFNDNSDDVNIEVTNKTYKLIKSTKDLIYNSDSVISLINLTKNILKIIDDYYWNNITNIKNTYYRTGFENWIEKNNTEISDNQHNLKEDKETLRSKWLPTFRLVNKDVFLHIPEHKIKNDYEYSDITIFIYEDNKKIKEINDFRVFSIIGGYKIQVPDIKLDNPLSNIQYKIEANSEIIYDSRDLLKNNYLIFNEKGISISSNKSYDGNIYVVYKENVDDNIAEFYKCDNYSIGSAYVKNDTILRIGKEYIVFNTEIISGIVGLTYSDTYISYKNRNIKVYQSINKIIFETEMPISEIGLKINDKRYRLDDFNYNHKTENGKNLIYITYSTEVNGYYEMIFFNTVNGKNIKGGKYEFFIDTMLEYNVEKIDKDNFNITINSGLLKEEKEYLLNIEEYDDFKIYIDGNEAYYCLPLNIPIYKIDNSNWHSIEDYIWIEDININSSLYIQGIHIDELLITNSAYEQLTNLKAFRKQNMYIIPIGNLRTYMDTTNKIDIYLRKNNEIKQFIECYMKCEINDKETSIDFDSETGELSIDIEIFGKGTFKLIIFNGQEETVYEQTFENSSFCTKLNNLHIDELYRFKVIKVATGFTFDGDIELYYMQSKFYSFNGLVNKNIKVKSVDFDVYDKFKNTLIRKTFYLHRTYFYIEKYLGNKKYYAKIYKWEGYQNYLNNVNPIEIELSSEIENGQFEVAAYKDGDGLLIDFENKTILDSLEDNKAPDIYSCKLNLK